MPIQVIDKLKHANGRDPVADAADIQMPDGTRLDGYTPVLPVRAAAVGEPLEAEVFYRFGKVSQLNVELSGREDGKAHEYWFEFEPMEGFAGLTISPEVRWVTTPQYAAGSKCLVGIVMGMAVMAVV